MSDLRDQLQNTLAGSYTLERELGGGGMSRVFLADELRFGRRVVVKVLSPELAAGISAERFEREIRLAASLQQANIVPVLAAGETNGLPYYTMPYVEGESLRAALSGGAPLAINDVLRIVGDVSRALQYAHERGIVHRDIKPDNVLLSGGTAVVTDFGIAKALSASRTGGGGATLTQLGTSIGTPAYMAPEQAAGDPEVDARADIYALGCMAYELLAGQPPFHGRTPQRMLAAHMTENPVDIVELRPDTPTALADIVMRALSKDPDDRPQGAAELVLALNSVTSGSGMAALPPTLLHGPTAFRRALLAYAGTVVGIAVVAKAATIVIGLPDWVFPGALLLMALGLPAILVTGYVQRVARRALTATPAVTTGGGARPHGTMATLALRASPHVSWKRISRSGLYAIGAFAAGIAVFMVMRALGIGPAGSLLASGKLHQRDPVLIADFGVSGTDSSVARVVAEGVRANLGQSNSITVASPSTVVAALARMQRSPDEPLGPELARQLAVREGIKAVVTGDVAGVGNGFLISLRLVSADSGAVLASYQATVSDLSGLVDGVDEVTRKLRGKIGESLKSVQASPPLAQVTTASYDALRAYSDAIRAFDVVQDYKTAIPLLQQAVAIDTGFAAAWRKLGTAYSNAGYPQSTIDSSMTRAFQLRARLTERERYMVEGSYYFSGPGRDRQKAVAAYQALLARGDTLYAANNLAALYNSRRDYAHGEALLRAALRKSPESGLAIQNLVLVLVVQGKKGAADSILAGAPAELANSSRFLVGRVMRSYVDDGYADAERLADSIFRATTDPATRLDIGYYLLPFDVLRGRRARAEQQLRSNNAMEREQGIPNVPALLDSLDLIRVDLWQRGDTERAAARLDAVLATSPPSLLPEPDRPYGEIGALYAMMGRTDQARSMLARVEQVGDTTLQRTHQSEAHRVRAEIAMAEGRPRDALDEFRRADQGPDGPLTSDPSSILFRQARAFDLANEPDSAIAMFEQYLATRHTSRPWSDAFWLPAIQKRLGELYEAKGDLAKAATHYAAFVDLWKDADPALQGDVTEVKRRLAALGEEGK